MTTRPSDITSAETDVNSPLSQTLTDKIREWIMTFLLDILNISTGHDHDGSTQDHGPPVAKVASSVAGTGLAHSAGVLSIATGGVISTHLDLAGQEVSVTAAKIGVNGADTLFNLANLATDYAHYPRFRLNSNTNVTGCASTFISNANPTTAALGECRIYIEITVSAVSGQTIYAASFWHQI